jgi:hypothetical protein
MSQDGKTFNVNALNSQSLGIVVIAIGFAILIAAYVVKDNILLMVPMVMLEVGIYGLGISFFAQLRGTSNSGRWGNDAHYTLFWSSIVTVIGVMWLVYDRLGEDAAGYAPAFIAVFLFYFGITFMLMNRNKSAKTKTW